VIAADCLLRGPAAPRRPLSPRGRRDRPATDPRRDEQPRDVWLSPRLGDGESHLPDRLQPEADSAHHAAARFDAGAPGPPPPRPPASRPDPAAGLESTLLLGCLLDSVLEATALYAHELGLVPITTPPRTAPRATVWPRPSWGRSSAIISVTPIFATPRRCWRSSDASSTTTTARRHTRRLGCGAHASIAR